MSISGNATWLFGLLKISCLFIAPFENVMGFFTLKTQIKFSPRVPPEPIENALRALFCEKSGFNMGVNGRGLGRFSFRPKSPQKGRVHLKHDFRLTERLLPDSTMTYRGRSDGLVVESDRKKCITFKCHLRDLQGYCVHTSGGFFFFFFFFLFPYAVRRPNHPYGQAAPVTNVNRIGY